MKDSKKILLLAGHGMSTNVVYNAITKKFGPVFAIIEEKENRKIFLKRRMKRLGFITVAGQVLFQSIIIPMLNFSASKKIKAIISDANLDATEISGEGVRFVQSVNSKDSAEMITEFNPDIVVVNGTRIISRNILSRISCPIINMHAGITPAYRGVHGAYWALLNNDPENCGVTVHRVDAGIDTGDIISQANILIDRSDNFLTYPVKQLSAGLPLLLKAIEEILAGNLSTIKKDSESKLYYHPTIWSYLYNRVVRNIR